MSPKDDTGRLFAAYVSPLLADCVGDGDDAMPDSSNIF
jgi:hypothetical protein